MVTSGLQYLVQNMNYKKDLERINQITGKAKATAWGPKMIPVKGQRKVRVGLGESRDEDGEVVGSKFIDMVVEDNGDVYLVMQLFEYFLFHRLIIPFNDSWNQPGRCISSMRLRQ